MDYGSALESLERDRQTLHAIKINEELLEHLESVLGWFIVYCKKNHIHPPAFQQLQSAVERAEALLSELPPYQPKVTPTRSTDNETESI